MITVADAIVSLRPGVEWSMYDNDVEGIIWHTQGVETLTNAEVQTEMKRLQKQAAQKLADQESVRNAALSHAKSLGFTDEMISVMYPTLLEES